MFIYDKQSVLVLAGQNASGNKLYMNSLFHIIDYILRLKTLLAHFLLVLIVNLFGWTV
ncbi:hypothetical protein SOASR029_12430 [Budvicia aquatica]|nr:hypothetical protein SOASR029_12430 [Budvicia aquatica]